MFKWTERSVQVGVGQRSIQRRQQRYKRNHNGRWFACHVNGVCSRSKIRYQYSLSLFDKPGAGRPLKELDSRRGLRGARVPAHTSRSRKASVRVLDAMLSENTNFAGQMHAGRFFAAPGLIFSSKDLIRTEYLDTIYSFLQRRTPPPIQQRWNGRHLQCFWFQY